LDLDPETEEIIHDGIKNLIKNRTTIIIVNRFSTIANTDKIYVIEDGNHLAVDKNLLII
jgi:ABC-type multidrug transport system fused ATPase/permease subunit